MYSPALRPSSTRAAPAKNRIWSSAGGISSVRVSSIGLPVFSHSAAMISSARVLHARRRTSAAPAAARDGVVSRQRLERRGGRGVGRVDVRRTETGADPKTSPVVGSIRSARRPSAASTDLPSMKFCTVAGHWALS